MLRPVLALGLAVLGTGIALPTISAFATSTGWTAYVANFNDKTVTPINVATNTVGTTIPVGDSPSALAITPNGQTAYVADSGTDTVTPISTATNTAGSPITEGSPSSNPFALAISPDGQTVYVANSGTNTVGTISTATNTAGPAVNVGAVPEGIVVTPNGLAAYVADSGSNTVTPINLATLTAGPPITVGASGSGPVGMAVTPDGSSVYVSNGKGSTVAVISTATNTVTATINVGSEPQAIAITPNGQIAYVVNDRDATVTPISVATNTAETPITLSGSGVEPDSIAITPDGATAFVGDFFNRTVYVINTATNTQSGMITVGSGPGAIAVIPDEAPVASLSVTAAYWEQFTSFDASASTVPIGSIVSYAWNFGDGFTATTSGPTTTHLFGSPGTFTATVTETDSAGTSTTPVFTGNTMSLNGAPSATASQTFAIVVPPPTTTTTQPPHPVFSPEVSVTKAAAVIQLTCFARISCAGSLRLTQTVTHKVKRGKRTVRVESTRTLGSCSEAIQGSQSAKIRMTLTRSVEACSPTQNVTPLPRASSTSTARRRRS
jgi:YVTN family beta-propeller protein